jgi:branched-chain amino acid transport system ATP-binding protein
MLEVADLHAYYGKSHILQGISCRVGDGEIVSLLGRNGAGRSTAVKTIMGLVPPVGTISFMGTRIDGLKPHEIARRGLGYVPEDRAIFPELTVRENLILGMKAPRQGRQPRGRSKTRSRASRSFANAPTRRAACCPEASSRCSPSAAP